MAAVVELAGVSIVRNGSTLISNITWEVDEADRWVVIGPNGAGKTTLLQVISAQIHPSQRCGRVARRGARHRGRLRAATAHRV